MKIIKHTMWKRTEKFTGNRSCDLTDTATIFMSVNPAVACSLSMLLSVQDKGYRASKTCCNYRQRFSLMMAPSPTFNNCGITPVKQKFKVVAAAAAAAAAAAVAATVGVVNPMLPPSGVWMVATAGVPKSMAFFADTWHSYSTPRSAHSTTNH